MTSLIAAALLAQSPEAPVLDDALRSALGLARLSPATARFDPSILEFYRQGEFANPMARAATDDPWRASFLVSGVRRQLFVSGERPEETIGVLSRMIGQGAGRDFAGNPVQGVVQRINREGALAAALERMKLKGWITGPLPSVAAVPEEVQRGAALVLETIIDAENYRQAAFSRFENLDDAFRLETSTPSASDDAQLYARRMEFGRRADMSYLHAAGQEIAAAAVQARTLIGSTGRSVDYRFEIETRLGLIRLGSRSVSTHGDTPTLLIIDTAGSDTYLNVPSNPSARHWASVVIDTDGDDRYLSSQALAETRVGAWGGRTAERLKIGPGKAAFGVTVLVDGAGDDLYRSARPGLGAADFGCSYLLDASGNDRYDAYADALGTARFGIGILEDLAGDDVYSGFTQVQGVGLTAGAGLLIDRAGNDEYTAAASPVDFPSAQVEGQNLSMAQGAGVGFRADYLNGRSQAGGVGILYDVQGTDRYTASVFAQGVGYWMGLGVLWDDSGADRYSAAWQAQGSGALYGLGLLEDRDGNDDYSVSRFLGQGAGQDFGIGILVDFLGNDTYSSGAISTGAAGDSSLGIFADMDGEDRYRTGGISLGYAADSTQGGLRDRALALGVFLDMNGRDDYGDSQPWASNGNRSVNWRIQNPRPEESRLGIFVDR
ncbi:MAG: hypothetical protein MH204_07455 [Fimbriimonadaceae bacterium]|nr:hypothetical protein [Fimbriimonadaceae bacterium]